MLANLLPGPLIALAPAMRRALRPGGVAVLSGLLDHQAREVGARYRAAGFRLLARSRRAGWTVLTLVRVTPHATVIPAGARMRSLAEQVVSSALAASGLHRRYQNHLRNPPRNFLILASAKASASWMTGGHDEAEAACYGAAAIAA